MSRKRGYGGRIGVERIRKTWIKMRRIREKEQVRIGKKIRKRDMDTQKKGSERDIKGE